MSWLDEPATISRIKNLMNDFHVPGLAVAIVDGSEIRSRAFGNAFLDPQAPCTPDTVFDIASCSKALTSLAVALLVENEHEFSTKVQWDSLMSSLLPDDFVLSTAEATNVVTVEDVLSHRTGLPSHDLSILSIGSKHPDTVRSINRNLRHLALSKEPRTTYQYSNMMYTVATHLIETLSQQSFSDFLHERILRPLGYTPGQGAGSIQSSVIDYAKFIRAMMNRIDPITRSIYKSVTAPRVSRTPGKTLEHIRRDGSPETSYALGWDVNYHHGVEIIAHDGIIAGYGSRMFILPSQNVGAVILGNSEGAFHLSAIVQNSILDQVLETPLDQREGFTNTRVKRFKAQEARREKDFKRNFERREQAKGTLQVDMEAYQGSFWNIGYRTLIVREMDGCLCVDGRDHNISFIVLLEHVADNTIFRSYLVENIRDESDEEVLPVRFKFDTEGKVIAVGLGLEKALGSDHLIWFSREEGRE
ncbi:beta-lactamase family protein [Aureobasidium pullulans]|nr:beta-lactamase family protein [Aureobasidium pullulans]THX78196.1 beta-lactamase family protein [Aureobasidium pullulans]